MFKILPLYQTFDFISEVNCVLLGIGRKFENEKPSDFCLLLLLLRLTQDDELRRSRLVILYVVKRTVSVATRFGVCKGFYWYQYL